MKSISSLRSLLSFTLLLLLSSTLQAKEEAAPAEVGKAAPNFTLTDVHGKTHSLADYKGKHVVLEWVNYGCPYVARLYHKSYLPGIQAKLADQDVVWFSVNSNRNSDPESTKSRAEDNASKAAAVLMDADGKVGKAYGARTTPHMFVIDPKGILIYQGAMDDQKSTKPEANETAKNYVQTAIEESLAGKRVTVGKTQPYGCGVKYAKPKK